MQAKPSQAKTKRGENEKEIVDFIYVKKLFIILCKIVKSHAIVQGL